jgi:hypothetical protein
MARGRYSSAIFCQISSGLACKDSRNSVRERLCGHLLLPAGRGLEAWLLWGKCPANIFLVHQETSRRASGNKTLVPKGLGQGCQRSGCLNRSSSFGALEERSFDKAEDLFQHFFFTEKLEGSSQPQATLGQCFTRPLSWQDRDNGQAKEVFKLTPKAGQRPD